MNKKMLDLLYRSFDDELSSEKKRELDRALNQSSELQSEKEKIKQLREKVARTSTPSFKPYFAERVANRVKELSQSGFVQQDFFESLSFIFKRVAIAASVAGIVLFSVTFFNGNSNSTSPGPIVTEVTLEEDIFSSYLTSVEEVL